MNNGQSAANNLSSNYKIISSETIQKWSKLQEKLKSSGKTIFDYNHNQLSYMLKKIVL